jgi:hypothetical protein
MLEAADRGTGPAGWGAGAAQLGGIGVSRVCPEGRVPIVYTHCFTGSEPE